MDAIDFLRKRYSIPQYATLSELKTPPKTWGEICQIMEEFKIHIKQEKTSKYGK